MAIPTPGTPEYAAYLQQQQAGGYQPGTIPTPSQLGNWLTTAPSGPGTMSPGQAAGAVGGAISDTWQNGFTTPAPQQPALPPLQHYDEDPLNKLGLPKLDTSIGGLGGGSPAGGLMPGGQAPQGGAASLPPLSTSFGGGGGLQGFLGAGSQASAPAGQASISSTPAIGSPEYKRMMESLAGMAGTGAAPGGPAESLGPNPGIDASGSPIGKPVLANDGINNPAPGAAGAGTVTIPELPNAPAETPNSPGSAPGTPLGGSIPKPADKPWGAGINEPYGPGAPVGIPTANATNAVDLYNSLQSGTGASALGAGYVPPANNNAPYGGGSANGPGNFSPLTIGGPIQGDMTGTVVGYGPPMGGGTGGGGYGSASGSGLGAGGGFSLGGLESLAGNLQTPAFQPPGTVSSGGAGTPGAVPQLALPSGTANGVPSSAGGAGAGATQGMPANTPGGSMNTSDPRAAGLPAAASNAAAAAAAAGTATPATSTPATTQGVPGGSDQAALLAQLASGFQGAQDAGNAANQARFEQMMGGYGERTAQALESLANISQQDKTDTNRLWDQQAARQEQNLISRGLGNTTVRSSVMNANERSRAESLNNLSDARNREAIGLQTGLSLDSLQALERVNDTGPDYSQLAALAQGLGQGAFDPQSNAAAASGTVFDPNDPRWAELMTQMFGTYTPARA